MRNIDKRCMEKFGTLGTRWPKTSKQEGDMMAKRFCVTYGKIAMSERPNVEVSQLEVAAVLRLKRDAWSTVR